MLNEFLLSLNFGLFVGIFVTLFHYRRDGATYNFKKSFAAFVVMVSALSIAIMIATGTIRQISIPHTILAATLLVAVINAKGNVAKLSKPFSK